MHAFLACLPYVAVMGKQCELQGVSKSPSLIQYRVCGEKQRRRMSGLSWNEKKNPRNDVGKNMGRGEYLVNFKGVVIVQRQARLPTETFPRCIQELPADNLALLHVSTVVHSDVHSHRERYENATWSVTA